jgi:hypothetical protein
VLAGVQWEPFTEAGLVHLNHTDVRLVEVLN